MSRPKVVNLAADRLFLEEAKRRAEFRTNKQLARELAEQGINLTPEYVGKLIADKVRELRRKRNIVVRMFHGEPSETAMSSGTIDE